MEKFCTPIGWFEESKQAPSV